MHGKMVYNSCGTGKTWIFKDLDRISDSWEDLGTVFRENLGIQVYPYDQCSIKPAGLLNNDTTTFGYADKVTDIS